MVYYFRSYEKNGKENAFFLLVECLLLDEFAIAGILNFFELQISWSFVNLFEYNLVESNKEKI